MSAGTIKKWLPCELYDAAGIEQWLDDMAARGYALGEWPGPGRRRVPEEGRFFGAVAFLAIVVLLVFGLEFSGVLDGRRLDGPESWDFPHVTLAEALPDGAELLGGV